MRNEKSQFNNIGISNELDMPRIRHLMKIGLATGVMALIGDILLGYGVSDAAVSGIPATVLFLVFFLILTMTQIKAFAKGLTPLPKWAWIFSVLFGLPMAVALKIPNLPLTNAFATGWINIGNIWMFCGLLCLTKNMGVVNKQE